MTRGNRRKRKNLSGRENTLPQSKKMASVNGATASDVDNSSSFTQDLLKSLNDPGVRAAYRSILTDALINRIKVLEDNSAKDRDRIATLEANLQNVAKEKLALESDLHELRQYTRRNALHIYNPNWAEPPPPTPGQQGEDTDGLILNLAQQLGVRLEPWEIGRSHRVGKPRSNGPPRPIIVKFISYNVRHRVFEARKRLKDTPALRLVYMNEDLTKENSALAYEARQLNRQGLIADTFTRDGRILVKRFANQRPKVIRDMDDLQSIVRSRNYNQVATGPSTSAPASGAGTLAATTNPIPAPNGSAVATQGDTTTTPPLGSEVAMTASPIMTRSASAIRNDTPRPVPEVTAAHPLTSTPSDNQGVHDESVDLDATSMSTSVLPQVAPQELQINNNISQDTTLSGNCTVSKTLTDGADDSLLNDPELW